MMMYGRYMIVIFIIYFSYTPEVKSKQIERILTRVESVMPIYKSTTQATFANNKEAQNEFKASSYVTRDGKNLVEDVKTRNENKKNVIRASFEDTHLTVKCDFWNRLKNNSVIDELKENKSDIVDVHECDNVTKTQCIKLLGEPEIVYNSNVLCRNNSSSVYCIRNSIRSCSKSFTIILNLGKIFRMDVMGSHEPYYNNITVIKLNGMLCFLRTCSYRVATVI